MAQTYRGNKLMRDFFFIDKTDKIFIKNLKTF